MLGAASAAMLLLFGFLHEAGAASYGSFPAPDGSLIYTDVQDSSGRLDTPVPTVGGLDFPEMSVSDACNPIRRPVRGISRLRPSR